jgi:hypothetical protein
MPIVCRLSVQAFLSKDVVGSSLPEMPNHIHDLKLSSPAIAAGDRLAPPGDRVQ